MECWGWFWAHLRKRDCRKMSFKRTVTKVTTNRNFIISPNFELFFSMMRPTPASTWTTVLFDWSLNTSLFPRKKTFFSAVLFFTAERSVRPSFDVWFRCVLAFKDIPCCLDWERRVFVLSGVITAPSLGVISDISGCNRPWRESMPNEKCFVSNWIRNVRCQRRFILREKVLLMKGMSASSALCVNEPFRRTSVSGIPAELVNFSPAWLSFPEYKLVVVGDFSFATDKWRLIPRNHAQRPTIHKNRTPEKWRWNSCLREWSWNTKRANSGPHPRISFPEFDMKTSFRVIHSSKHTQRKLFRT